MPVPHESPQTEQIRGHGTRHDQMQGESETSSPCCSPDCKVHVAVGCDIRENVNNLMWTLRTFRLCKIVILHVHQHKHLIPAPCKLALQFPTKSLLAFTFSSLHYFSGIYRKDIYICLDLHPCQITTYQFLARLISFSQNINLSAITGQIVRLRIEHVNGCISA